MKKFLIFAVLISLSFWGCSENSDVVGPADTQQQEFLKVSNGPVSDLTIEAKEVLGIEKVNILQKGLPSSTSKVVENGDEVPFLLGTQGVLSLGKLGIVTGIDESDNVKIKLVSNNEVVALELKAGKSNPSSQLAAAFIGVDVSAGDDVKFWYLDENEEIIPELLIVGNGWVVVKAHLAHFSRYGFTKRTDN